MKRRLKTLLYLAPVGIYINNRVDKGKADV
jgi:hypothetical protein